MRIQVLPGCVLMLTGIVVLSGTRLMVLTLAAALVHELGHVAAIKLCGAGIDSVCLAAGGARITVRGGLGYWQDAAVALAGPAAGGLFALMCRWAEGRLAGEAAGAVGTLGSLSALYSIFNLFPMSPMDGGRAINDVTAALLGPRWAYMMSVALDVACGAAMAAGGAYIFVASRGNVTALICAGLMIKACCKTAGSGVKSHNRKVLRKRRWSRESRA